MKKSFLFLALALGMAGVMQAQNARGHFSMRYSGGVAETNLEAFCRTQLPKLCAGSTFEVTRDNVDQQGYRHVTMQQYVNGIRANGMTVNVHVFNGKITSINGNVLTQDMVAPETLKRAPRPAAQILQTAGLSERLAEKAELVLFKKDGLSRVCYRVLDGFKCKHIDAFTGEVISDYSILQNAIADDEEPEMVKGKGQTMFSGIQDIDVAKMGSDYTLFDTKRGIFTLNASMEVIEPNGFYEVPEDDILGLIDCCDPFINDSPDWLDPSFKSYLKDIAIQIANPDYLGKNVYATIVFADRSFVDTDTLLIENEMTRLTLPFTIDHDEQDVLAIGATLIDPETGEKELVGDGYYYLFQGSNAKLINLKEDFQVMAYNYFEGYSPLIDIHWGIAKVSDFYNEVFGYNSFDGNGTEIYCLVNPPEMVFPAENACAAALPDGFPGLMIYGLGGVVLNPVVDFTVTGHEYTHLVARKLSKIEPDDAEHHAKALNESFADIMGLSIYRHVFGKEIWGMAPFTMRHGQPMRLIDNPELSVNEIGEPMAYPSCYLDENFDIEKYEEHLNSTVQSHMFYLLVTGGEGINSLGQDYAVTPMDRDEAEKLAFNTVTEYVDEGMSYEDAPEAWITSAIELFGENSPQLKSVCQAWAAVGLPQDDVVTIEQISHDTQKRGLRYNLHGQRVGEGYTGVVIEI